MKYVVIYESADDVLARVPEVMQAHRAWYQEFVRRGDLIMVGPFSDATGALSVLTSRAAAEEFASGDPFVTHGLVRNWYVREWAEVLVPEGAPEEAARG
ncbi:MAG TPA: YciI family protein [Streptosporangiaceae bacterium]|nr:YciI family protein [Streptosporangiaceae bacterium]